MKSTIFQRYFLPGFVYQSAIIAGGYATGRELAEFFMPNGTLGGLLGMAVAGLVWSLALAATFELARITRSFDYRSLFRALLGRFWFLFELAYLTLFPLVLAVIAAASGTLIAQTFGIAGWVGTAGLMTVIGILVFFGSSALERFFAGWSFVLYATYIVFIAWSFFVFGDAILANLKAVPVTGNWIKSGIVYAGYNISAIPVVLFCLTHLQSRRDAVGAGLLGGPIAILPGVMFYLAMIGLYPQIAADPVPSNLLLNKLGVPALRLIFYAVVFGTFIETGAAFIHSFNERIARVYADNGHTMPDALRPAIAVGLLLLATTLGVKIGLVDLVAKGYGTITYAFIAVYLVPLFTIGLWKIARTPAMDVGDGE